MFVKTFKKAISLFVVAVFILSLVPVVGMAATRTDIIPAYAAGYVTDGNNANKSPYYANETYVTARNSTGTNLRYSFIQYDLTDWWKYLQEAGTTVNYKLYAGGAYSNNYAYAYSVYILPGDYTLSDLTFNNAKNLGLFDVTNQTPIAQYTGTPTSRRTDEYLDINKDSLLNALSQGHTGILTLLIKSDYSSSQSSFGPHVSNTGFEIIYDDAFSGDSQFLSNATVDFAWNKISSEDVTTVSKATKLPSKYNGVRVAWTASSDGVIDENGNIIQSRDESIQTTLTATFSCGNADPVVKTIDVEILKLEPVSVTVNYKEMRQINAKNLDTVVPLASSSYYLTSGVMYDPNQGSRGDEHVFMKWDLSAYKKYIDVATGLSLNIGNRNHQGDNGIITLLNDRSDDWSSSTLTYNYAVDSGMYTDPGLFVAYNVPFNISYTVGKTTVDDPGLLAGIKAALAQDPDEGLISFRLSSANTRLNKFQIGGSAGSPYIEITYYEEDLPTDADFVASKKDTMTWAAISYQDIDNVVADLTLPSTWYGQTVTWGSSDESVITSSGEVTTGNEKTTVTLTATIDGTDNKFEVTVPACKIAVKSDRTHIQSGSALNYSTAYIYASEDITGNYEILLATYSKSGELSNLTVAADDFVIKEGLNIFPSTYHYAVNEASTKVIIVNNMEDLTPLTISR